MHMDLEFKILSEADLEKYIALYHKLDTIMDIKKETALTLNELVSSFKDKRNLTACCMQAGEIVVSVSGFFPETFPHWYSFNHFSIFSGPVIKTIDIFNQCHNLLCAHAEENGYFSYYTRRLPNKQRALDKMFDRHERSNVVRYHPFYEAVYPAGVEIDKSSHKFFKNQNADSLIVMYTLDQKHREEILAKKYPNLLVKHND